MLWRLPRARLFPYTTLFRSSGALKGIEDAINSFFDPFATWLSNIVFYAVPLPGGAELPIVVAWLVAAGVIISIYFGFIQRSEEHTSELQSRPHLVCRLLLEK